MRANLPERTTAEKAMDSVTTIDELLSREEIDQEALEAIERNARHLEIMLETQVFAAEERAHFEAAILLARS